MLRVVSNFFGFSAGESIVLPSNKNISDIALLAHHVDLLTLNRQEKKAFQQQKQQENYKQRIQSEEDHCKEIVEEKHMFQTLEKNIKTYINNDEFKKSSHDTIEHLSHMLQSLSSQLSVGGNIVEPAVLIGSNFNQFKALSTIVLGGIEQFYNRYYFEKPSLQLGGTLYQVPKKLELLCRAAKQVNDLPNQKLMSINDNCYYVEIFKTMMPYCISFLKFSDILNWRCINGDIKKHIPYLIHNQSVYKIMRKLFEQLLNSYKINFKSKKYTQVERFCKIEDIQLCIDQMNALVGAQFNMFDTFEQTLKNCFKFLKAAQLTYDFEFLILYAESCVFLTSQSLLTNHEISVNESSEQNIFKILNEKFKFESYHWLFLLNKNSLNVCQWAAATERDYLKPYLEKINGLSWPTINKRVADYALQAGYISASEKYYRKEHDYNAQFLSEAIIRGNIDMLHGLVSHLSQKLNIKQDQFFSSEQVICLYFSSKELLANLISTFFVNQNILLNCQTESVEFLIYLEAHGWNVNMKVDIEQDILLTTLNELLKMEQQGGICSNITFLLPDFLASERSNYKLRTKKNILKKDKYGFTILHFMACLNVINSKPFMLKYCNLADMNQVVSKSFLGDNYTPIELAILKQNNFFLKGLLDMKFNFNKPGLHGVKYIELAILNGRYESVKFLIDEANIDIDSQFLNTHSVFKKTIFHYAVGDAISDEKAAMRIIKLLIKRTKFPARLAALLIKLDDQDNSVLGIATSQKKDKIVRFILDYVRRYVPKELDTLILKANNRGYNSISFALDNQNLSILKELFENITDKKKFYEKSYNKYINIAKRTNNKDITSFILKQVLDYKKMKKAEA